MFQKFKTKDLHKQDLNDHKFDVREDEEQSVKLQEIIDLLVAAGYFRARIKGLSPFDKVVGGMTWCIESCNVDVDVDLLFQENSTIGQKIALTEKIVIVLPKLKCPHSIEPHQIQGLDFIHIFPVIQWLVKRSLEFRQEKSEFVRKYAVYQFHKVFGNNTFEKKETILKNVNIVNEIYGPKRYYRRKNAPPADLQAQVQITLLEYGNAIQKHNVETMANESVEHEDLDTEDLKNLAEHYTSLQLEFKTGGLKYLQEKQKATIEEQLRLISEKCAKLASKKTSLEESLQDIKTQDQEFKTKIEDLNAKMKELKQNDNDKRVEEVEELVMLNENLKLQESQFREHCKKEMAKLQNKIKEIKSGETVVENDAEANKLCEELTENVKVIRLQLAKRNRTVAALRRQIDDVPNRPELAQYQRRFLELYNQVSAKHKETKQYYTLYNTLEDTKFYMKKELSLLNSVSDSYPEAVLSASGKDEFLKQFQNIVEGVKQSKEKVERKLLDEKRKRDQLSAALQVLIEQQRKYVAATRQLSIECKKHEALLAEYKC
ncbi:coiled-coil domain-containing protein 93 [Tribolium castaneum]|uniref:coiled-coil domain-containing protein 93 n=1 Tax=Tribolium castaneum TaxID=7070 RepID=UPI0030FEE68A